MNGTELFDSTISVDWAFCHDPSNASYLRWVCFLEIIAINVSWIFSSAVCWYVVGPSIGVSFKQGRYAGITLQQCLLVIQGWDTLFLFVTPSTNICSAYSFFASSDLWLIMPTINLYELSYSFCNQGPKFYTVKMSTLQPLFFFNYNNPSTPVVSFHCFSSFSPTFPVFTLPFLLYWHIWEIFLRFYLVKRIEMWDKIKHIQLILHFLFILLYPLHFPPN